MGVSDLEAVCRSEAQRVLTCLRGNRKFGSLHRSWRELEEGSPIRQLSEWRSNDEASAAELLRPLLQIVRSPEFAGPTTYAALEAAQAVAVALCETARAVPDLAATLAEVSHAVCECVFEETNAQVDEATAMQMITVLGFCGTTTVPTEARLQAFDKVLSLWGHYRHSQTLRACAQAALQRMLDFACSEEEPKFVTAVLGRISWELGPLLPAERVLLYLRCLQRLTTHPAARRWAIEEGQQASFFQDAVPVALLSVGEHFCGSVSVLSLLLPIVNRSCWLCMDHWSPQTPSLGALQVEALVGGVYLRALARAAAPLRAPEGSSGLAAEEGAERLVVILEALCDLLRVDTVRALWATFDADWRKPALLEQLVQSVVELFRDDPRSERPLPAHIVHLTSTVLARIVTAFASLGADSSSLGAEGKAESARVQEQFRRRELLAQFVAKMEESPKKTKAALEKSGLLDILEMPAVLPGSMQDPPFPDWALKLAWVLRCLNHVLPYAAMGEFFGQPTEDSQKAFAAFVDTFDFGPADVDEALRSFLQAFLLPKEGQQIDRVIEIFAQTYYRKHVEQTADPSSVYLKNKDAAHTLAFSIIMLNTDQHNAKVKRRMQLKDFLSNNRQINDGENIPEEVQMRIFESIHNTEIKTPSSGSLTEGISAARWADFMQLIRRGYRDNALAKLNPGLPVAVAHAQAFLDRMGERIRMTLEHALATDAGAHSDALQGQERLLQLTMQCRCGPAVDGVAEGLFFFGAEVFHELQPRVPGGRAVACLRTLFRTALARLTNMSTKQLHMMVYLTAQFALYGLCDRALPANDTLAARLLRTPALVVDPPTGVVYSFLRKISTAPFKMLSYTEEEERNKPKADGAPQRSPSSNVPSGSPRSTQPEVDSTEELQSPEAGAAETSKDAIRADEGAGKDGATSDEASQASLHHDPLRPQIERAFESCDLEVFIQAVVQLWPLRQPEAAQVFLGYLSSLFLTLRAGAKVNKEPEGPWWPEPPVLATTTMPQALQLPKRALALNVLDGYEILRLTLRLMTVTIEGNASAVLDANAIQDFSLSVHAGLFHTIRRSDLSERTLRVSIAGLFQAAATLLRLRSDEGYLVSTGWPVRLIAELLRRAEAEPQFLVPAARLCLESVRAFVIELAPARPLDRLELWKALLLVLLKAVPTPTRALWPGAKDREMEAVQNQLWMQGVVWLLGHPQLLECLGVESVAGAGAAVGAAAAGERSAEGGVFWPWALGELSSLAQDVSAGARPVATRLLLDAYTYLLASMARARSLEEYAEEDIEAEGASQHVAAAERSAAWSRVAISLLSYLGPALSRPYNEEEPQPVPLLKQAMLNVRVPSLLGVAPQGPYWARLVLEKLIASLTNAVSSGAPLSTVREAVSLVAKFFLQNLHTLQRHDCFGQLWLMVLRLMLLFIKRGTDDRDTELEEIATETLKNLLCVLLSTGVLVFVAPKRAASTEEEAAAANPAANGEVKIWWQMTWDCIEVFLPGFGEDFSKSMLPAEDTEDQATHASAEEPASVSSGTAAEQPPAPEATDVVGSAGVECPAESELAMRGEPVLDSPTSDAEAGEEPRAAAEVPVQPEPAEVALPPTTAAASVITGVPAQPDLAALPQEPPQAPVQAEELTQPEAPAAQLEAQPPAQPEAQPPEAPPEAQQAAQPEAQPAAQPEAQPAAQPEAQPSAQPEAQPEAQLEAQPEAQLAAQPEAPTLPEAPSEPEALEQQEALAQREVAREPEAARQPEVPVQSEAKASAEAGASGPAADLPVASEAVEEPAPPAPERVRAPRGGSYSAKGAEEPGGELAAVLARRRKAAEARAKAEEEAQAAAVADK